jgi:ferredoxin
LIEIKDAQLRGGCRLTVKAPDTIGARSVSMKVRIIKEECFACGVCADIAPAIFEMGDDAAQVRGDVMPEPEQDAVRQAAESCPQTPERRNRSRTGEWFEVGP